MSRIGSLINYKCPSCEQGSIYKSRGFFRFGKMNKHCPSCNFKFEKEPGFFYGAMYVSYALTVAQIVGTFVICQFFFNDLFDARILPFMIGVIFIMSPINFKLSRVLWMYFFTRKNASIKTAK